MTFRHAVLINFKADADESYRAKVAQSVNALPQAIPQVLQHVDMLPTLRHAPGMPALARAIHRRATRKQDGRILEARCRFPQSSRTSCAASWMVTAGGRSCRQSLPDWAMRRRTVSSRNCSW